MSFWIVNDFGDSKVIKVIEKPWLFRPWLVWLDSRTRNWRESWSWFQVFAKILADVPWPFESTFFHGLPMVCPWFSSSCGSQKNRIRSVRTYLDVFESKSMAHIDFDTTGIDGRMVEIKRVFRWSHLSFQVCSIPLPRSQHPWLCYEPSQSLWEDFGREMALCHGLCSLDRNWLQSRAMPSLQKFHSVCVLNILTDWASAVAQGGESFASKTCWTTCFSFG